MFGMEKEELCPELVEYIYRYQKKFMTKDEILAGKTVLYPKAPDNEKLLAFIKSKGWYSDDEHIKQMIANGHEAFKQRVAARIFDEHRDQLELNLCPKCGKLARTPLARQCRFCFYDWHNGSC
jgi:hypothetical protein